MEQQLVCQFCKGTGGVTSKLKHLADCSWREHYHVCDNCGGKGYFTKEDIQAWFDSFK